MRVVVSRVKKASVKVDGKVVGKCQKGILVLVSFTAGDGDAEIEYLAKKCCNLRIFDDENGVMNKSILEVGGEILSISQFTLHAMTRKGNRPSYIKALNGEEATILYDLFNQKLEKFGIIVRTGIFGSEMKVELINDGPITIIIDSKEE